MDRMNLVQEEGDIKVRINHAYGTIEIQVIQSWTPQNTVGYELWDVMGIALDVLY